MARKNGSSRNLAVGCRVEYLWRNRVAKEQIHSEARGIQGPKAYFWLTPGLYLNTLLENRS